MKILYVCTSTETGGAELALRALARAAAGSGAQVHIVSLKSLGAVGQAMQKEGFVVDSLQMQGRFSPLQYAGALARLLQIIEQFGPHIVHAFLYRAIQLCRLAKRRASFKLITSPHYDLSQKNFFLRLLDRALKNEDDVSGAESAATQSFLLKKQRYNEHKLRLVVNGIDTQRFKPDAAARASAREKLGFTSLNIVFCCVARLCAEKNQRLLLQAFAALYRRKPHVRLLLVGDGPEGAALEETAAQQKLGKAVYFAGEVSDVSPFLLASDVFVLSSSVESLPLSLLEACSCALPCIVSKVGDMPLVIRHGDRGYVFNGKDGVLLSVLMAELADNKTLRESMGYSAREYVCQHYPAPEQIYLKIYQEMI